MRESYREIDYRLRPAKNVERKMLAEAFTRLSKFARVDSYRYVGMGSLYFSDFVLFHRSLGFQQMISIEKAEYITKQERIRFNQPFKCVQVEFGTTNSILPNLTWEMKNVVWLDYDGKLDKEKLADIFLISSQISPGSMFIVSINVNSFDNETNKKKVSPLNMLKNAVGDKKVRARITSKDLTGWKLAEVCRQIISNEIDDGRTERNQYSPKDERIKYQQLFNFHYEDGAKMLTVGGIFYTEKSKQMLKECAFDELDFYRPDETPFLLGKVPLLTFKEIRALNSCLPFTGDDTEYKKSLPPITEEDKNKYARLYRYYPTFAETEV